MKINIEAEKASEGLIKIKVCGKYVNSKETYGKINNYVEEVKSVILTHKQIHEYVIDLTELQYDGGDAIGALWTTLIMDGVKPVVVANRGTRKAIESLIEYSGMKVDIVDKI